MKRPSPGAAFRVPSSSVVVSDLIGRFVNVFPVLGLGLPQASRDCRDTGFIRLFQYHSCPLHPPFPRASHQEALSAGLPSGSPKLLLACPLVSVAVPLSS